MFHAILSGWSKARHNAAKHSSFLEKLVTPKCLKRTNHTKTSCHIAATTLSKKSGKYPTTKETQPKKWCIPTIPSCNMPSGQLWGHGWHSWKGSKMIVSSLDGPMKVLVHTGAHRALGLCPTEPDPRLFHFETQMACWEQTDLGPWQSRLKF